MRKQADDAVEVSNDEAFDLLRIGQQVETPLGSGRIVDIAIQAGKYGDRIEMEPPAITVDLDKPPEDVPKRIVVCMCKLGLEDDKHEAIIRKEFHRLWPPLTDEIHEDAHMLMDLNKQDELDKVRSRFERHNLTAHRVASVGLRYRRQRQLFRDYAELALHLAEPTIDTVDELRPGMVVTALESVDMDNQLSVVLKSLGLEGAGEDGGRVYVLLYNPEEDSLRQLTLPEDEKFMGHDGEEATGMTPTVYDPERLVSPELHPIRVLPNSYIPKSPNYPSSITDTVWRPTVRQTPIRFYETKKDAGFDRPPEAETDPPRLRIEGPNYPVPDTVNPPDPNRGPYMRGQQAFDPSEQTPDMEETVDQDMEDLAMGFWDAYQSYREQKIPGGPQTLNFDILDYADIFKSNKGMTDEEMGNLFAYLMRIGICAESLVRKYIMRMNDEARQVLWRTHF